MKTISINKIISGQPLGSSRPIIAETTGGVFFVKLRGSAQGTGPLIAEVIANYLAKLLLLPVLQMSFVTLEEHTPCDDIDQELADLIDASLGINLAYPYLENGRDVHHSHLELLSNREKAALFWLDQLLLNPDRMTDNSNLFYNAGQVHIVDFGSSLAFQYNWKDVTEFTPLQESPCQDMHVFNYVQKLDEWTDFQEMFAQKVTRDKLEEAVAMVPECFIKSLLSIEGKKECRDMVQRRKLAYVAFLWKRVKSFRTHVL